MQPDPRFEHVVSLIRKNVFGWSDFFDPLCDSITVNGDYYLLANDFPSYIEAQVRLFPPHPFPVPKSSCLQHILSPSCFSPPAPTPRSACPATQFPHAPLPFSCPTPFSSSSVLLDPPRPRLPVSSRTRGPGKQDLQGIPISRNPLLVWRGAGVLDL